MKRTTKQNGKMDLTPTWADIVFELRGLLSNGPDRSLTAEEQEAKFWGPIYKNLEIMAMAADKWNEHAKALKGSLFNRITPQELAAEGLVLLPRSLLREGQIDELIAWLDKSSAAAAKEADELEEFSKRREGKNVVPLKSA